MRFNMAWYDVTGNIADWFNTAGTLGTFAIAVMAYRKAPDWIRQRKDEDAFSIASELINENLPSVGAVVQNVSSYTFFLKDAIDFVDKKQMKINEITDIETCIANLEIWKNRDLFLMKEIQSLQKLKRLGWYMKPETLELLMKMRRDLTQIYRHHTTTWIRVKEFIEKDINPLNVEIITKSLNRLQLSEDSFGKAYESFEDSFINIEDYFEIKHR